MGAMDMWENWYLTTSQSHMVNKWSDFESQDNCIILLHPEGSVSRNNTYYGKEFFQRKISSDVIDIQYLFGTLKWEISK